MTNLFHASIAPLTALGLLLASPATAQTPQDPAMPMPGHMMGSGAMPMMGGQQGMMPMMGGMGGGGMMGAMMMHPAGYAAFLKAELGITEAQTGVWTAYVDQLQAGIKRHQSNMPMGHDGSAAPRSWIERLTDSEARLTMHLDMIKNIKPAASALYAALSPEQKQKADLLMPGGMMGTGGMRGMGMDGMH